MVLWTNIDTIIGGRLFLGSLPAAESIYTLEQHRITHVISVCNEKIPERAQYSYMKVPVEDDKHANLLKWLPSTCDFIDNAMQSGGVVLVHSRDGISRSATVVAAYLMFRMGYDSNGALEAIHGCRPYVKPNDGFKQQLRAFEARLISKVECKPIKLAPIRAAK
ncbi:phosphatases II [Dentipellis sp. KUC8613]|nr:phosphatases II [Dentipellis sp. KUC8613]